MNEMLLIRNSQSTIQEITAVVDNVLSIVVSQQELGFFSYYHIYEDIMSSQGLTG